MATVETDIELRRGAAGSASTSDFRLETISFVRENTCTGAITVIRDTFMPHDLEVSAGASSLWSDIIPNVLKVPLAAYRHRHRLHKWWKLLVYHVGLGKTNVVVTGRSGVGKSILSSRMRGLTEDLAWDLPDTSKDVETSVISLGSWARIVSVIPGQTSQERDLGLHEAFSTHESLQGVIHVVDWGFGIERDFTLRKAHATKFRTLKEWRDYNLEQELEEFRMVCNRIRESYSRCRRPKWMVIAVNKADLFLQKLDSAQKYYHPKLSSPFTAILRTVRDQIGDDHFACGAVPVSSWDHDFEWNKKVTRSDVGGSANSRALFRNFIETVSSLATRADGG